MKNLKYNFSMVLDNKVNQIKHDIYNMFNDED